MRLNAPFGLAFATAPLVSELNLAASSQSPDHYAKGTQSPCLRKASTASRHIGFRFYFTPLTGVLFNFPSRYWFTIGRLGVFSLRKWFSQLLQRFHLSRDTWGHPPGSTEFFRLQDYHLLGQAVPGLSAKIQLDFFPPGLGSQPSTPRDPRKTTLQGLTSFGFGLFRFRSPLLTESNFFLLLGLLRCFTSPRLASCSYEFRAGSPEDSGGVAPFGNLRIKACLRLPEAYRSLPRPSSPLST